MVRMIKNILTLFKAWKGDKNAGRKAGAENKRSNKDIQET
jgi:hypothetical protein